MSDNKLKFNSVIQLALLDADPMTATDGTVYYNTTLNRFRKYQDGSWVTVSTLDPNGDLYVGSPGLPSYSVFVGSGNIAVGGADTDDHYIAIKNSTLEGYIYLEDSVFWPNGLLTFTSVGTDTTLGLGTGTYVPIMVSSKGMVNIGRPPADGYLFSSYTAGDNSFSHDPTVPAIRIIGADGQLGNTLEILDVVGNELVGLGEDGANIKTANRNLGMSTGDITIKTGDESGGGSSGSINLEIGSATGGTGKVKIGGGNLDLQSNAIESISSLSIDESGLAPRSGMAELVGGTAIVLTEADTDLLTSRIFLTSNDPNGGTVGALYVSDRSPGVSFTISSTSALDTSKVAWMIVDVA